MAEEINSSEGIVADWCGHSDEDLGTCDWGYGHKLHCADCHDELCIPEWAPLVRIASETHLEVPRTLEPV